MAQVIEGWFVQNPQWFAAAGAIPGDNPDAAPTRPRPTLMSGTAESRRARAAEAAAGRPRRRPPRPPPVAVEEVTVETIPLDAATVPATTGTGTVIRPLARPVTN